MALLYGRHLKSRLGQNWGEPKEHELVQNRQAENLLQRESAPTAQMWSRPPGLILCSPMEHMCFRVVPNDSLEHLRYLQ
jgi:hypothetical protein